MPYIREQMLPELAAAAFHSRGRRRLPRAVTATDDAANVLYRSDPDAPVDPLRADASASLFGMNFQAFLFGRPPRPPIGDSTRRQEGTRLRSEEPLGVRAAAPEEELGRWRLLVQHQSGSLEAAVARARRQNLAISFGVLLLLTVSIALLAAHVTARAASGAAADGIRRRRVARTAHAGRGHPLGRREPVARRRRQRRSREAIRQLLETEARRLGEMVERVLQYAGIESGLGYRRTRRRCAPTEIIEGAIDSSLPLLGPDDVTIASRHRSRILPTVVGDAAALRSAVQNLIANAVKYGGRDRWVGIRAEHVRRATPSRGAHHRQRSRRRHSGLRAAAHLRPVLPRRRRGRAPDSRQRTRPLARQTHRRRPRRPREVTTRAGAGSSFTIALASRPNPMQRRDAPLPASCRRRIRSLHATTKDHITVTLAVIVDVCSWSRTNPASS